MARRASDRSVQAMRWHDDDLRCLAPRNESGRRFQKLAMRQPASRRMRRSSESHGPSADARASTRITAGDARRLCSTVRRSFALRPIEHTRLIEHGRLCAGMAARSERTPSCRPVASALLSRLDRQHAVLGHQNDGSRRIRRTRPKHWSTTARRLDALRCLSTSHANRTYARLHRMRRMACIREALVDRPSTSAARATATASLAQQ